MNHSDILSYIEKNKERFLNELMELLQIPTISADSDYLSAMAQGAEAVARQFKNIGVEQVEIWSTKGHHAVFASKIIDVNLPTILIYGHYDVQPASPESLWHKPPFEPYIQNGKIYGRGACDDKGQFFMHIKALETMLSLGSLPCNVKFLIEGEEEIGSPHLSKVVQMHQKLLQADVILISDTSILANDTPSIDVGLRGLSYLEVEVVGPNRDLHSGVYGGAVANPINVLCQMIASLHDANNHITIPHFYDDVIELSDYERNLLAQAPFDEQAYAADLGIMQTWGEKGYTVMERTGTRPTLDVNGIWGGYTGEGSKTILPSKAYAKISMRLVPNQKSERITELFSLHFTRIAPPGVNVRVTPHHGGEPYITPIDSIEYKAAELAMQDTFGKKPIPTRGGGSIPIVKMMEETLNCKVVLMGFGLDSDNIHSPNEHFGIFNFLKGIETIPLYFNYFTDLYKKQHQK